MNNTPPPCLPPFLYSTAPTVAVLVVPDTAERVELREAIAPPALGSQTWLKNKFQAEKDNFLVIYDLAPPLPLWNMLCRPCAPECNVSNILRLCHTLPWLDQHLCHHYWVEHKISFPSTQFLHHRVGEILKSLHFYLTNIDEFAKKKPMLVNPLFFAYTSIGC